MKTYSIASDFGFPKFHQKVHEHDGRQIIHCAEPKADAIMMRRRCQGPVDQPRVAPAELDT